MKSGAGNRPLNILIVGAGALGQVFGHHLSKGGAAVSYLVKPNQLPGVGDGFRLYELRRGRAPEALDFKPRGCFASISEVAGLRWDYIWLCVPSTALREPWVQHLKVAVGGATIVSIGQDVQDRPVLERTWSGSQIVELVPSLFAYLAPLHGEQVPQPGVAFWIPPNTAMDVSGDRDRVGALLRALRRGGLHAKYAGLVGKGDMTAALMMPFIAALEVEGWSLRALRKRLRPPAGAAREAAAVVASQRGLKAPPGIATSPFLAGVALAMFERMAPFDLEQYFKMHFTKVRAQTRLMLDGWIDGARAKKLAATNLEALRAGLLRSR